MRYTEIKLQKIADELLADLDKETVDLKKNYDSTLDIPDYVLPTKIPNLLVNGSSGIAVGLATNIPTHNLRECIQACLALMDNPDITIRELMRYIPAPDFPTGALIYGRAGIESAYLTGRGRAVIRSRCETETDTSGRSTIVVTEIPYNVNKSEMVRHRQIFTDGAAKLNHDPVIAGKIFDIVEKFAEYGFNKSHSAAYALVAWWTLYLKVHYPAEFLAAMMTADCMKTEKLVAYIGECHRLGIKVNPPDVNIGKFHFGVDEIGNVVYGFSAIKGIGEKLVDHIVMIREKDGSFTDFFDFVYRVSMEFLSKGTLEALVKSGALDSIGPDRATMLASIPTAIKYANQKSDDNQSGQMDLFAGLSDSNLKPSYAEVTQWTDKVRLYHELLGLYLSGHPIDPYKLEILKFAGDTTISNMIPGTDQKPEIYVFGAVVSSAICKPSPKDPTRKFYILCFDDGTSTLELPLFGKMADRYEQLERELSERSSSKRRGRGDEEIAPPLILIVKISYVMSSKDGQSQSRMRVLDFSTLEELRIRNASALRLYFTESEFEKHGDYIDGLLVRNRLNYSDIEQNLRMASDESTAIKGCRLDLVVGNRVFKVRDNVYRFLPTDDLIELLQTFSSLKKSSFFNFFIT